MSKTLVTIMAASLLMVSYAAAQNVSPSELQFREALHKQQVEGDPLRRLHVAWHGAKVLATRSIRDDERRVYVTEHLDDPAQQRLAAQGRNSCAHRHRYAPRVYAFVGAIKNKAAA